MNLGLEITLAKEKVFNEGFSYTELVNYFAGKKIYHTIALMIFSEVFKTDTDFSREYIYNNKYYSDFKNEKNPFNEEFISINNQ